MKLLVFNPYYPPHLGGLELHAQEFSNHLANQGIASTIITSHIPTSSPQSEQPHANITIYRLPTAELIPAYPLLKTWLPSSRKMMAALDKVKFDIVISRTRFFTTSLLAYAYTKKRRLPYVHIEHGSGFVHLHNPFHQTLARLYDLTFGRYVLTHATAIVANSQASARFVTKLAPQAKPIVIYRGINQDLIYSTPAAKPAYVGNKLHVVFAGRLIDGKGIHDLLHVLAKMDAAHIICTIIGHGPQYQALQNLITKFKLSETVHLVGAKNQTETISLLKAADIFVHPSYTEGLPSSVIEAALCRCAIIATDVGGTNEIITHEKFGLLVPPRNHSALEQALQRLIDNPAQRQAFGQAAYHHAQQTFNWDTALKKYLTLFNTLQ